MHLINILNNSMNTQKPLKADLQESGSLQVYSIFHTIQGEGPFAGTPAMFVRLAGCNLKCPACDTQYTGGETYTPEQLLKAVNARAGKGLAMPKLIVITGGEPLRQNVHPAVHLLSHNGFHVQIETNGTMPYPVDLYKEQLISHPTIVCSPKTSKVHPDLVPLVHSWKYVLEDGYINDRGLPERALQGKTDVWQDLPEGARVYVQPIDTDKISNNFHLASTVSSALTHGYILCLQVHKIANLP